MTIDLRSDTVTRPTPAMRAAMAEAEVGDDVYGEDPTVNRLEARAAEIFGREAALFVPTGTMGNQIAIRMHTEHGQEVICESRGHLVDWEMSMVSAFSGCQLRTVYADRGILTWPLIRKVISPGLHFRSRTGLISLENTHNLAGGTVMPLGSSAGNLGRRHRRGLARASRWRTHLQCRDSPGYSRRSSDQWLCLGDVLPLQGPVRPGRLHAGEQPRAHRAGA